MGEPIQIVTKRELSVDSGCECIGVSQEMVVYLRPHRIRKMTPHAMPKFYFSYETSDNMYSHSRPMTSDKIGQKIEGMGVRLDSFDWSYKMGVYYDVHPDSPASSLPAMDGPCVYFMEAVGLDRVKIGYTEWIQSRVSSMGSDCPYPIRLAAYIPGADRKMERSLHRQFAKCRARGEWFEYTAEIANFIKSSNDVIEWHEEE